MKRIYFIASLVLIVCVEARAGVVCSTISNASERAYCRAIQTGSKGQCSAIADYNLRQQCLVRLGARKTLCDTINSSFAREQCKYAAN
jgi:hypothetical protein